MRLKNKKTFSKKIPKKTQSSFSPEAISPGEEALLRQRLAALKAREEEKELKEKIVEISQKVAKDSQKNPVVSDHETTPAANQDSFNAAIEAALKAFWEVPILLKNRQDLWAEVEIEIAPDGHILSWHFTRRSGEPLFDEAVRSTLKKADPLPAPGHTKLLSVVFRNEKDR